MPAVQVFHIEKRVTISGGLNRHITRVQWVDGKLVVWVPANANEELTKNNVELVSREFTNSNGTKKTLSLQEAVNKRIADAKIKPRKGQTRCLEMIFSGSHEEMCNMSREDLLKWANDTLKWAQKTWGKENVVSASLHLDEKTPHIHMIVVPIVQGQSRRSKKQKELDKERGIKRESYKINTEKLRLCANEVYTTPLLYHYHDHYAKDVSNKYGLERGLRAEPGSRKKHQDSEDYNRQLAAEAAEKQTLIAEIKADYTSAVNKKEEAERKQQEAEQNLTDKENEVDELEKKSSSLSGEIKQKEAQITELDATIDEKDHEVSESFSLKEALDTYNEQLTTENQELQTKITENKTKISEQQTTIDTNSEKISTQEDDLAYYEQQLDNYKDIENAIQIRKNELQSLASFSLLKLVEKIPEMIRYEIQSKVSKYWKGTVQSYERVQYTVENEEGLRDFVKINMRNEDHDYFIEVREDTGDVFLNGSSEVYKWKSGKEMNMPELASYFNQELLPSAKEAVSAMYKKVEPKPAEAVEQGDRVVWECNLGINNCRIVEKPDGICNLEREEWEKSKVDQNGRYTEKVWKKQKGFKSFKELKRDKDFAYLELTHSDGKKEYVNQYGNGLSPKQKKSLGIPTSGMTLG